MEGKIQLLPGVLNDENRDYLPLAIQGSTMVVNENGNSSQVYPKNLREYREVLLEDGVEDVWYEYVPDSYDPNKKTPLVFSVHGGLMTGWGQCIYTSWSHVADREGFLCVFPNASAKGMWMIECDSAVVDEITTSAEPGVPILNRPTGEVEDYHDVRMVMALLEKMRKKYNIDPGRVYIQGMSMGNCMTSQVARYLGNHFAGAAGSGCPTNCKLLFDENNALLNKGGCLDVWQSRLQHDRTPPHYGEDDRTVVIGNINYWRRVNGCRGLPQLQILGEKNLLYYPGDKGNVMVMDVFNRDHGQTFDDAQMVWDYLFSGVSRREDGQLIHGAPRKAPGKDAFALALAEGAELAWVHGEVKPLGGRVFRREKIKYHGLNGSHLVRGSYLYAPVAFLTELFGGEVIQDGLTAEIRLTDGRRLTFAHGCIGCAIDNSIESMLCEAITREGKLYVPAQWFCAALYDLHTSNFGDVFYATDHYAVLSRYTGWILEDILRDQEAGQRGRE